MKMHEKIRFYADREGITQDQLAIEFKISQQAVQQWYSGETRPKGDRLKKLSTILRTTVDNLLDDDQGIITISFGQKTLHSPQNQKINLSTIKPRHYGWPGASNFSYSTQQKKEYKEMSIEKDKLKLPYSDDCFSVSIPEGAFGHELKHECRVLVNPGLRPEPGSSQIALVTFGERTTFARYKKIADREIYNILENGYPETFDATGLDPNPEIHGVVILRRIDDYPE